MLFFINIFTVIKCIISNNFYPHRDQIYHLLTSARSQIFNLTSLFVDERKGDVEPNLAQLPTQPPHYRDGYGGSQPPPGGRFSPAGYNVNNWNSPTSDKPPNYPGQPDRWRQGPQTNGNLNNGQTGVGVSRSSYSNGSRRQSRAQNLFNQRRNSNFNRGPIVTPKFNYDIQTKRDGNDNFGDYNYGVTQHNRVEPYNMNNGFNQPSFPRNFSGFHPQDIQRHQEPYQIQPPSVQHNVKGQGMYPVMTMRPHMDGNWKGSPSYIDYSKTPSSEPLRREPIHSRLNRRERQVYLCRRKVKFYVISND